MDTKCFWIEKQNKKRRDLRRFTWSDKMKCPNWELGHNKTVFLDIVESDQSDHKWPHDDPRWPTHCDCGYKFEEKDEWQLFCATLYKRADTGEEFTLAEAPPGAMWNAEWMVDYYKGPDGMSLGVKLPNGRTWNIDSRASNCTKPDDKEHKCWVRHGTPPDITVDKNGLTCDAGAGSIIAGDWHGFLRNGELVT